MTASTICSSFDGHLYRCVDRLAFTPCMNATFRPKMPHGWAERGGEAIRQAHGAQGPR